MEPPQPKPRKDSFGFLRLMLALMVVFGHSFPLGGFADEPITTLSRGQASPDSLAVKGFFILSGFLLAHSLAHHASLSRFAVRRFFRIMPAFWVCLLVSSFVLVPGFINAMAPGRFTYWQSLTLGHENALTYVTNNALLQIRQWNVWPVFLHNKFPLAIDGSLWTLSHEALCYIALGIAAPFGLARRRSLAFAGFAFLYIPCVVFFFRPFPNLPGNGAWITILNLGVHPRGYGLMLAFISGVAAYTITRGKPFWNPLHFGAALAALTLALLFGGFSLLWPFLLPYLLLSLAYRLPFHGTAKFGDFSYGTYLYAFPIQQSLYAFGLQQAGFCVFFGLAALLSVLSGVLSWMLVERPAIRLGSFLLGTISPIASLLPDRSLSPIYQELASRDMAAATMVTALDPTAEVYAPVETSLRSSERSTRSLNQ